MVKSPVAAALSLVLISTARRSTGGDRSRRMTVSSTTLAARAEAAIRRLRAVEGVSVRAEGDDILEIHVLTSSERPPKNIVRDVQTVLRTGLGVGIDHRVVSVARAQSGETAAAPG